ncbi:MAG: hypothetical protein ACK5MK_06085 [Dysgonomonas sp.]
MNNLSCPEIEALMQKQYVEAQKVFVENNPIILLDITDQYTAVVYGTDYNKPEWIKLLPIGVVNISRDHFKHCPPRPVEVEEAIMIVEDEVMSLKKEIGRVTELVTFNSDIREIAILADNVNEAPVIILPIKEMESVFSRFATIINGFPASMDALPETDSFAATLLILREFMHHLGFNKITVK